MSKLGWPHLGEQVKQERAYLRYSQADVQARGGPSTALLRQIENGRSKNLSPRKKTQLEDALGWTRGAVDKILAGAVAEDLRVTEPFEASDVDAFVSYSKQDVRVITARRPRGMSPAEWKRMADELEEEIAWKLDRATKDTTPSVTDSHDVASARAQEGAR